MKQGSKEGANDEEEGPYISFSFEGTTRDGVHGIARQDRLQNGLFFFYRSSPDAIGDMERFISDNWIPFHGDLPGDRAARLGRMIQTEIEFAADEGRLFWKEPHEEPTYETLIRFLELHGIGIRAHLDVANTRTPIRILTAVQAVMSAVPNAYCSVHTTELGLVEKLTQYFKQVRIAKVEVA